MEVGVTDESQSVYMFQESSGDGSHRSGSLPLTIGAADKLQVTLLDIRPVGSEHAKENGILADRFLGDLKYGILWWAGDHRQLGEASKWANPGEK